MHLARTDQLQPLPAAHPRSETLQGREPAFQHAEAHLPRLTHTFNKSSLSSQMRIRYGFGNPIIYQLH